jgi:hypothetical protein
MVLMDPTPSPPDRTLAQAHAARVNGARSAGPVTVVGKTISAANAIRHGYAAQGALMPGETPEQYEANVVAWFDSLRPANAAEAKLVARLADVDFRQDRLARAEERLVAATVEQRVKGSPIHMQMEKAEEALAALRGLIALAGSVPATVDADDVRRLLPALRDTEERVSAVDLAPRVVVALGKALDDLVLDSMIQVTSDGFAALALAAREVEASLVERIGALTGELAEERAQLTDTVLFGDGEEARRLDRHRARLGRELDQQARALKAIRELARDPADAGSGSPVAWLVELRVVGRAPPR